MGVFRNLFPSMEGVSIVVEPSGATVGSIRDSAVIRFIFGGADDFDKAIDELRETPCFKTVLSKRKVWAAIVLFTMVAAPVGGVVVLGNKFASWLSPEQAAREVDPNVASRQKEIIKALAIELEVSEEELANAFLQTLNQDPRMLQAPKKLLEIGGTGPNKIALNDFSELELNEQTLSVLPRNTKWSVEKKLVPFRDVVLEIRAAGVDSRSKWAGKISQIFPGRVKVKLHKDVSKVRMHGVRQAVVNVQATMQPDEHGELIPLEYLVTTVLATDRNPSLFQKLSSGNQPPN